MAVAAVVLNRVKSSQFPNTISGVIYQSGAFSCVSNGSINNTPDSSCIRAALDAMNGWDPTGGCLYYYNPKKTSDSWIGARTVVTVIGSRSPYKGGGPIGRIYTISPAIRRAFLGADGTDRGDNGGRLRPHPSVG